MIDKNIVGVTLGWSGRPQLMFAGGQVLFKPDLDFLLHPEYFPDGKGTWPKDPETGKKLRIAGDKEER